MLADCVITRRAVEALKAPRAAQNAANASRREVRITDSSSVPTAVDPQTPTTRPEPHSNLFSSTPDIRFHDLRHTCATLLLSRGHHPKLVRELLGHVCLTLTLDRYPHVLPGMGDQTAASMEAALSWMHMTKQEFSAGLDGTVGTWPGSWFRRGLGFFGER